MMRYAVFGPRDNLKGEIYSDLTYVKSCLSTITDFDTIICGGGKGIELLAEQFALDNSIEIERIPPNFRSLFGSTTKRTDLAVDEFPTTLRRQIFEARNDEMMRRADRIVVFWDGMFFSIGQIIKRAICFGKPVVLFPLL